MSLSDRIAKAQRTLETQTSSHTQTAPQSRRRTAQSDPFGEVKRMVHAQLVQSVGPKLYDANMTQTELEQLVRATLQNVMSGTDRPMSDADRNRIAQLDVELLPQEVD